MNSREIVRRLEAWHAGRALPRGETRHFVVAGDADALIVAFVRMGGESRPWGLAFGRPNAKPTVLTVPEARNRDLVADMMATFAPTLLKHLRCPGFVGRDPGDWDDLAPLRQVWLPNATHIGMLHHLAYAYTFTRWGGRARGRLNAFGRACGWMFREAQRPGQQNVFAATEALRNAFTFPAEDMRQGHLGFLLAWIRTRGSRARRLVAAMEAERQSIATNLDPDLERGQLEPCVERWGTANRGGDARAAGREERLIHAGLTDELLRRFDLATQAIGVLRADKRRVNAGVPRLVTESLKEQWYQHTRIELRLNDSTDGPAFVPSVETDREPRAAASRYHVHQASADFLESVLLHDDTELQAEAVAAGDAFRGTIVNVADEGTGKSIRPVWTVHQEFETPLHLRIGGSVCQVGLPSREGTLRRVSPTDDGGFDFEVEITKLVTKPRQAAGQHAVPANDPAWEGVDVVFAKASASGISRRKSQLVWNNTGPGAWLTHARPGGQRALVDSEDTNDVQGVAVAEASG